MCEGVKEFVINVKVCNWFCSKWRVSTAYYTHENRQLLTLYNTYKQKIRLFVSVKMVQTSLIHDQILFSSDYSL